MVITTVDALLHSATVCEEPYECRGRLFIHIFVRRSERTYENHICYPLKGESRSLKPIIVYSETLKQVRHVGLFNTPALQIHPCDDVGGLFLFFGPLLTFPVFLLQIVP